MTVQFRAENNSAIEFLLSAGPSPDRRGEISAGERHLAVSFHFSQCQLSQKKLRSQLGLIGSSLVSPVSTNYNLLVIFSVFNWSVQLRAENNSAIEFSAQCRSQARIEEEGFQLGKGTWLYRFASVNANFLKRSSGLNWGSQGLPSCPQFQPITIYSLFFLFSDSFLILFLPRSWSCFPVHDLARSWQDSWQDYQDCLTLGRRQFSTSLYLIYPFELKHSNQSKNRNLNLNDNSNCI